MIIQIIVVTLSMLLIIVMESLSIVKMFNSKKATSFHKFLTIFLSIIIDILVVFVLYIIWYGYYHPELTIYEITHKII